jgi:aminoglycoside/choline kinase family phosphotransferase
MAKLHIPTTPDELTSEWLTESLRASGVLREARVSRVKHEMLGSVEGFMGLVVRLHLAFDEPEAGAPRSLIAKLPTSVRGNRAIGELVGAYEREILFYREIAAGLPVRTPKLFFAVMDGSRTSRDEAAMAAMLDRWPMWAIRLMMVLVTWIAARRRRRYVLLIEDLGAAGTGDQVAGCRPEEAREILLDVARVHARYWRSPTLAESYWLRRQDLNPRTLHSVYLRNAQSFTERFRVGAPANFAPAMRWLEERAVDLLRAFHASTPETLLHCDLRLDNVSFSAPGTVEADRVVFFDWQLTGRGPGAYDVAYLLSGALATDVPVAIEQQLVHDYHAALLANGVSDYAFEQCLRDYRRGLLAVLHRVASTNDMELGGARAQELIGQWLRRTLARLEGVDFDSLLPG